MFVNTSGIAFIMLFILTLLRNNFTSQSVNKILMDHCEFWGLAQHLPLTRLVCMNNRTRPMKTAFNFFWTFVTFRFWSHWMFQYSRKQSVWKIESLVELVSKAIKQSTSIKNLVLVLLGYYIKAKYNIGFTPISVNVKQTLILYQPKTR